jgi:galactokinase/mevalonate kinase-like predicted kinase
MHTGSELETTGFLALHKAVYRRIVRQPLCGTCLPVDAMHQLRRDAYFMKDVLLHKDLDAFSATLGATWQAKKRAAAGIPNAETTRLYDVAIAAGALSGKVSGAGGSGFQFFIIAPERCCFTEGGAQASRV